MQQGLHFELRHRSSAPARTPLSDELRANEPSHQPRSSAAAPLALLLPPLTTASLGALVPPSTPRRPGAAEWCGCFGRWRTGTVPTFPQAACCGTQRPMCTTRRSTSRCASSPHHPAAASRHRTHGIPPPRAAAPAGVHGPKGLRKAGRARSSEATIWPREAALQALLSSLGTPASRLPPSGEPLHLSSAVVLACVRVRSWRARSRPSKASSRCPLTTSKTSG